MLKGTDCKEDFDERYSLCETTGILKYIDSKDIESDLTTAKLMERIFQDSMKLEQQNKKRLQKQANYEENREFIQET